MTTSEESSVSKGSGKRSTVVGARNSDSEIESLHGASSVAKLSTHSDLLSSLMREAALSSLDDGDSSGFLSPVPELLTLPPAKVAGELLGFATNSLALSDQYFISMDGKSIGNSPLSFSKSWNIAPHSNSYYDPVFHDKDRRRFNYDRYDRSLGLALTQCVGDSSALQVYCHTTFYPRTIADVAKAAIMDEALTKDKTLNPNADILGWWRIQKVLQKDDAELATADTSEEIKGLYKKYVAASKRVLSKIKEVLSVQQGVEQPQFHHPINLLRQWVNLPLSLADGNDSLSKIVDIEKKCHARLSLHSSGITIPWKLRRLLLGAILRSTPLFASDHELSFCNHVEKLEQSDDGSPDKFLADVVSLSRSAGFSSVEKFLGISPAKSVRQLQYSSGSFFPNSGKRRRSFDRVPFDGKRRRGVSYYSNSVREAPNDRKGTQRDTILSADARPSSATPSPSQATSKSDAVRDEQQKSVKKPIQCYRCGQVGHYAYKCPQKQSKSDSTSGTLANLTPNSAVSLQISQSLLTIRYQVISEKHQLDQTVTVALDTMSSTNIVSLALVKRLGCDLRDDPTQLKSLGNSEVPGKGTDIRLLVKSKGIVSLYCLVVAENALEGSCGCELLVGYKDLPRLGVSIIVPSPAPEKAADSLDEQIAVAKQYLSSNVGKWFRLDGAPSYRARLRPTKPTDNLDTPEQCWVYEVDWDESNDEKSTDVPVHDYSGGLIAGLSGDVRTKFRDEIDAFCKKKWWFTGLRPHHKVIRPAAVTFPVQQGSHKSTSCRPCSDLRPTNKLLPPASYRGRSVGDIIDMVRCRYRPHFRCVFMDLSKAFLRLHLGGNKVLEIKCDNKVYYSDRVLFGYKHGPVSLSGHVVLLLNAVFSAMTGRRIEETSINAFSNIIEGLTIAVFYDDILVLGEQALVFRFKSIIRAIAPLCGSEFPDNKCDDLREMSSPVRHLGVWWSVGLRNDLQICCVKPDPIILKTPFVTRRLAFAHAGVYYDPLRCHPSVRLISDYIRHVFGQSPGGSRKTAWNKRWRLSSKQLDSYNALLHELSESSLGDCSHSTIPADHEALIVHCDASSAGYGYLLHSVSGSQEDQWADLTDPSKVLLEASAGSFTFRSPEYRWHINRKEATVLHRSLTSLEHWLGLFSPYSRQVRRAVVYCDNKSAVSWSTSLLVGTRSYDKIALQRLVDSISTIVSHIRDVYGVELEFKYLEGKRNSEADRLSRLSASTPKLVISESSECETPNNTGHTTMMTVTTCAQDVCSLDSHSWSSHRFLHPHPTTFSSTASETVMSIHEQTEPAVFKEFNDLTAVGNMTENDIIKHTASALACEEYIRSIEVVPKISIFDILVALGVKPGQDVKPGAAALCEGPRASFCWDSKRKVLLYRDFKMSPEWYIYLFTPRARSWVLYHYHHAPLTGCHRSASRCLQAVLKAGFYFPKIGSLVRRATERCRKCQLSKAGGPNPQQPFSYRRGNSRFAEIQLDFLGPMKDCEGLDQDPNNCPYIALMVDCATNFVIGCPVSSTSTNCVIYALLQWIAVFGRPKVVQLDSPPTHSSEELRRFLEVMDITRSLGISRRPQCQGRVENVVKEIKIALKCNSIDKVDTLPWWVSVQCAICVHNNARSAPHNRSPTELCFGTESPILELPSTTDSVEGKWEKLHSQIADDFFICNAIQSDDAHRAEMAEIAHKAPFRVYSVGDKVRLSRLEDGKRVLRGPFTVTELNDSNPFLYRLDGWSQGWVSLNQLLPFKDDSNLELFNHAVRPHQAYSASIFRLKFPDDIGIPLDEVSSGDFIIYPVDENVSDDGEPHRTIYIMEVMDRDNHILHALSLNRDGKNRWVRPPVRDRQEFMWDIDDSAILGAFKPTRTRRLPMKVSSWLSEHGAA